MDKLDAIFESIEDITPSRIIDGELFEERNSLRGANSYLDRKNHTNTKTQNKEAGRQRANKSKESIKNDLDYHDWEQVSGKPISKKDYGTVLKGMRYLSRIANSDDPDTIKKYMTAKKALAHKAGLKKTDDVDINPQRMKVRDSDKKRKQDEDKYYINGIRYSQGYSSDYDVKDEDISGKKLYHSSSKDFDELKGQREMRSNRRSVRYGRDDEPIHSIQNERRYTDEKRIYVTDKPQHHHGDKLYQIDEPIEKGKRLRMDYGGTTAYQIDGKSKLKVKKVHDVKESESLGYLDDIDFDLYL